jgi:hypothetical protein
MKKLILFRKLSGYPWLIAAILIGSIFIFAQFCGFRDATNVLSGTVAYQSSQLLFSLMYIILYCGVVIVAPILIITFIIINGISFSKLLLYKALEHKD